MSIFQPMLGLSALVVCLYDGSLLGRSELIVVVG